MYRKITPIFQKKKVLLRETKRAVTPFGGLCVFFEFLQKIGYGEAVSQVMPFRLTSPNAIAPAETFTAFVISVLAGARRFAHSSLLRADRALQAIVGIRRFPTDDTIRNFFKRFRMGEIYRFYWPLWQWQMQRLQPPAEGYTLDLDSTVFERYGRQEGSLKGYNPKKRGRPSHHPLLAILAESYFVLNGWLRSGNTGAGRGAVDFLKESLELLADKKIRLVRADTGFCDQKLLRYLEDERLSYIVAIRMTSWVKKEVHALGEWERIGPYYEVGEFETKLYSWKRSRRFVVIREQLREKKSALGRPLLEIPGYTFRVFVTNRSDAPEQIWREYNLRGDAENRVAELKYDLAADDFCMKQFFATEAAFRAILLLFNLLSEFQRATAMTVYRRPTTLRTQVFLCGAILGRKGHDWVLHLSEAWGGLQTREPLLDKLSSYSFPTSPKLHPQGST